MVCPNCSSDNPEGQLFCGKCGRRLAAETIASLSERIAKIERQQLEASRNKVNEHTFELETAEKVMTRVKKWTTLILYFGGIPAGIALLTLAIMFGKGSFDMYQIAANAKTSVDGVLKQAQSEAASAKNTAHDALVTSQQVNADIKNTERSVTALKNEVDARSADVQKLGVRLDATSSQADLLSKKMNDQEQQAQHLNEQFHQVQLAKGVTDIQTIYPVYGKHVARNASGFLDPKAKPADVVYVDLNLSLTTTPSVSDAKVSEARAALEDRKYSVTVGPVYVVAVTAMSSQNVGMNLDSNGCMYWVVPATQPPCIVYFRASLKKSAEEVRNLLKDAQDVPDSKVFYSDPAKLADPQRELLNLSAVDMLVVLGQ